MVASNVSIAASVDWCGSQGRPNFCSYHKCSLAWLRIWTGTGSQRRPGDRPDHRILGVPGQVGAVEVGEVIVENARLGRLAGDHVQHRLI